MPTTYENIDELSKRTKLSIDWWQQQCNRSDEDAPPHIKLGQIILFEPKCIDKWIRKHSKNLDAKKWVKNWLNNSEKEN
jgi:hypothetical protein